MQQGSKQESLIIVGPSLKTGGVERSSVNVANSFAIQGYNVKFIALFRQTTIFNLYNNIDFIEPLNFNERKLNLIKSLFWLRKTIKAINPYRVLVFNYFYGAIVRLSLTGSKIQVFVSDRASPFYKWPKHVALFNYIIYKLLPPAGMIAQTETAALYQKKNFKEQTQIKVIPNILREVKLYPEVKRQKKILAVGRLDDYLKGFDRLIESFSKIKSKEWELVFAGDDKKSEVLKQKAEALKVSDRIIFLGNVKEIDRIYAESGIFVIPSRSEGFPNALCEAMAAGLPCIAFDFMTGPRDIIEDGLTGFIIENGNINALASKIDELIINEAQRIYIGENAKSIQNKLNADKIGKEYLDFILKNRSLS
jgi:glycosyltransferase involved in cell wall biosynthesis